MLELMSFTKEILVMSPEQLNVEFGISKINGVIMFNDKFYSCYHDALITAHPTISIGGLELRESIREMLELFIDSGMLKIEELHDYKFKD